MTIESPTIVNVLHEFEDQGLSVKAHNALNGTRFIKKDGIFLGYIATSDELIESKEENRLNLRGISPSRNPFSMTTPDIVDRSSATGNM